jgi:hypothetical protein
VRDSFLKSSLCLVALFITVVVTNTAYADGIVFAGPDPCFPAGVGRGCGSDRSPHVLSIQSPGNQTTAAGAVARSASGDVRTGDWLRGSNTQTVSLAQIGLTQASNLVIYFDINEPNGQNRDSLVLDSLVLTAYDANGNNVFSASLIGGPLTLEQLGNGQGHSDYVFALDAAAAARLQAAMNANPNLFLGLNAGVSNAQGGPESFFIGQREGPAPIPEPATLLLLGTGVAGVAAKLRSRRKD